jgi:hypothetical protein
MTIECCADTLSGPPPLYKSLHRAGHEKLLLASCEVPSSPCRLHSIVERGGGKSTRDLQIFREACPRFIVGGRRKFGGALDAGWWGVSEKPHFSRRTREMAHPAILGPVPFRKLSNSRMPRRDYRSRLDNSDRSKSRETSSRDGQVLAAQ